jgi:putative endonuclease
MLESCHLYILSSSSRCLYVGVTRNLIRRWLQHRDGRGSAFCAKYRIRRLVYVEACARLTDGIAREKQLKRWNRRRKVALIEGANPQWRDLAVAWGWHRIESSATRTTTTSS